jgi:hypothetical protein
MYHTLNMWNTVLHGKDTVLYFPFAATWQHCTASHFSVAGGKVLHLLLLGVSSEPLHEIKRLHTATVSRGSLKRVCFFFSNNLRQFFLFL